MNIHARQQVSHLGPMAPLVLFFSIVYNTISYCSGIFHEEEASRHGLQSAAHTEDTAPINPGGRDERHYAFKRKYAPETT